MKQIIKSDVTDFWIACKVEFVNVLYAKTSRAHILVFQFLIIVKYTIYYE